MRHDLEQQLKTRFPALYPADFTFYVADGWFDVLWALSDDLERMGLALPVPPKLNVQQVKEKFGALRFYVTHAPDAMRVLRKRKRIPSGFVSCAASPDRSW